MSSVKTLNAKAEVMGRGAALFMNINAAKGLYDVMKTNLGPKGTINMLVGGAGGEYKTLFQTNARRKDSQSSAELVIFQETQTILALNFLIILINI